MRANKKLFICFICEKRYAEMEEAEICERLHEIERAQLATAKAEGAKA